METLEFFGYVGALGIGLILGLTGSGGSIMAVPILTYLFQINPVTTTAYSLFVVGTTASVGTVRNLKKGMIDVKTALIFSVPCVLVIFATRRYLLPWLPQNLISIDGFLLTKDRTIMLLFSVLVLTMAVAMLRKKQTIALKNKTLHWYYSLMAGFIIGVLTGIVGIGGGFLIVPLLVLCMGLPMKNAVATSLFIIAIKSLSGFVGDLGNFNMDWNFLLRFTLLSFLGMLMGLKCAKHIKAEKLKMMFAWFLLFAACGILGAELFG